MKCSSESVLLLFCGTRMVRLTSLGFLSDSFLRAAACVRRKTVAVNMNESRESLGLTLLKPRSVFHKDVLFPGMLICFFHESFFFVIVHSLFFDIKRTIITVH